MFESGLEIIVGLEGWLDIVDRVGVTAKLTVTPTRILQIFDPASLSLDRLPRIG